MPCRFEAVCGVTAAELFRRQRRAVHEVASQVRLAEHTHGSPIRSPSWEMSLSAMVLERIEKNLRQVHLAACSLVLE